MFIVKILNAIGNLLYNVYYFFFDRYILYPILKYVSKYFDINFMNLGYELDMDRDENIDNFVNNYICKDDPDYNHILLYEKALSQMPNYPRLTNKSLLEIGCGQGGGLRWLSRSRPDVKKFAGVDRIVTDDMKGLVKKAEATNLPYPNDKFDVIINVESSHLYKDVESFFNECQRVLKPGGYLCWIDLRYKHQIQEPYIQARKAGLILINSEDVTQQVLKGIHKTSAKYDKMLAKAPWIAKLFGGSLRENYCAPGTHSYRRLDSREKVYHTACWQKATVK